MKTFDFNIISGAVFGGQVTEDGKVFNHEHINRSKLRVDARKWAASKMNPKKYGDRITTEHQEGHQTRLPKSHDEELMARIKVLREKLGI